jgi:hypothetical protein
MTVVVFVELMFDFSYNFGKQKNNCNFAKNKK